jgi:hypothetical protein
MLSGEADENVGSNAQFGVGTWYWLGCFRPLNSNASPNSYPYSLNLQIRGSNEWEPVLLRVPEKIRVSDDE